MAGIIRYNISLEGTDFPDVSDFASVAYDEFLFQDIEIADGAADTALAFGGVTTVDVFYLKSSQAITLNLEAAAGTDITVDANKPFLITGGSVTGAWVSNASGSTAIIRYGLWGT